ncbi:MAG: LPS export ABC transporter periplasmic protein LptC [Gemmatimonadaceae bacterium]|nr:LPS export ABC transporter periplasmic protein LptC [Gemmatimonadaceae bacterium]
MSGRLLTALATCAIGVVACKPSGSRAVVGRGATLADSAEQVMFNVRTLLTDKGVQRGELFADTAYVFDDNRRFELRKVRATFNKGSGAKDGVMSADRGRYNTQQQLLEGFGNVVIVTNEGRRLTSPQLRFSQGLNEVSSDTSFTFVEPGRTISGVGFKSDPQLTRFNILRGAKGSGSFTLPGT